MKTIKLREEEFSPVLVEDKEDSAIYCLDVEEDFYIRYKYAMKEFRTVQRLLQKFVYEKSLEFTKK